MSRSTVSPQGRSEMEYLLLLEEQNKKRVMLKRTADKQESVDKGALSAAGHTLQTLDTEPTAPSPPTQHDAWLRPLPPIMSFNSKSSGENYGASLAASLPSLNQHGSLFDATSSNTPATSTCQATNCTTTSSLQGAKGSQGSQNTHK
nr:uncharacterized protein CI109_007458 [Kwoniella shandongensis]KAA5524218.1 hypothetical protein CI109_007458 [Kwoniella shandongensis]